MRYLDLTLAAYVGESVIVRYDPRDMAEIRVFHDYRFLCRAICAELAGETISLRDIMRARNRRRRDLRQTLQERARMVDVLLEARRGDTHTDDPTQTHDLPIISEKPPERTGSLRLKRYINE
jgi:putative transposase